MQMLDESVEERKWPHWLKYVLVAHVATLFWALMNIPRAGYSADFALFFLFMWLPLFVFAGYFFEKPKLNVDLYRLIYVVLAIIGILMNVMFAITFIE